jgi:uncharacterized protein (TIGR04141 family)
MAPIKISMSIYLLKTTTPIGDVEKLFEDGNASPLTNGLEGVFVSFPSPSNVPNWFRAVSDHLSSPDAYNITGQSTAGMILISLGARHFAITFGHAWQYLEIPWLEPEFGRRVALGTIPPDQMIEVNSEQVFAKRHAAKERAPQATSYRTFGVDPERDLVGAVEGKAADKEFGTVIRGATSLRVNISINTIMTVLDKALKLFASNAYRRHYPNIDNLVPVVDPAVIVTLDQALDGDLKSGKAKNEAVLFAPSFLRGDATSADAFAFGRRAGNLAISPYLTYSFWERHLQRKHQTPTLALAISTPVHMIDAAGDIFENRSVYDCLGYELSSGGKQYVLSSGTWYAADLKFLKSVENDIAAIASAPVVLPLWDQAKTEGEYNHICCKRKGSGLLHFDEKLVHVGGGQSKFEFCDFMDPKKKILFFAKIPSKSSACSHFVEQVNRTIELLFSNDDTFRKKLKKVFAKHYPAVPVGWLDERPRSGDWKICLVALGREKEKLPLFAKCSIAKLSKDLDRAGHPLMYIKV